MRIAARCSPLVICVALTACAGVPGVTPSVRDVAPRIERVDLDGLEMAFNVKVSNPLLNALHSPRYRYSIDVAGRTLASGRSAAGVEFPAAGVGTVTIPARVGFADLAAAFGDLEGRDDVPYTLHGAFAVPMLGSRVDLPFEHSGSFPVVRAPTLELLDVDTSALSPLGGELRIDTLIENPNAFAISIDGAGYAFEFGGTQLADLRADTGGSIAPGAKRRLSLTGRLSIAEAAKNLLWVRTLDRAAVVPTGTVGTPYGLLHLAD